MKITKEEFFKKYSDIPPSSNKIVSRPPLLKQVQNFATSTIRHVLGGLPQAPDEERDRRMSICKECPFFESGENPRCKSCGCPLKIKTSWAGESCPQGKWGSVLSGGCGCSKPPETK